jgi:hypothetical protein
MDKIDKIINDLEKFLETLIEKNKNSLKEGRFIVRPGIAYDRFDITAFEGSYDGSLSGLVHHYLYEKGHYKKFLPAAEFKKCEKIVKNEPEGIYGPEDDESVQRALDEIHGTAAGVVGRKLLSLKIKIPDDFKEHLINIGAIENLDSKKEKVTKKKDNSTTTSEGLDSKNKPYYVYLSNNPEQKIIYQELHKLFTSHLSLFKSGILAVNYYKNYDFLIYPTDGSYKCSFYTLIHHILFNHKIYEKAFSDTNLEKAKKAMKVDPLSPPALDDEGNSKMDEYVNDSIYFVYLYCRDKKLNNVFVDINKHIENYSLGWPLLE